jgi:hypothetical protein
MDAHALARLQALSRAALGAGLVAAPGLVARSWVGGVAAKPGAQSLAIGMGARDVGMGLGTLYALRKGRGAGTWIRAGMLADGGDLMATLRARDSLPALAVPLVAAMAGGSVLLGAWLQAAVD